MTVTFSKGEDAKRRVLQAAFALFLEQGYDKTTMRQIVHNSGVLNGSVYHAFKNKDAIFEKVFEVIIDRSFKTIRSLDTDILTYTLVPIGYELKFAQNRKILGDLVYHANRSWVIYNNMVERMCDNIMLYAESKGWPFSRERVRRGTVTVLGATRALVDEYTLSESTLSLKDAIRMIAMFCATIFLVPLSDPDEVVERVIEIIGDEGARFSEIEFSFADLE